MSLSEPIFYESIGQFLEKDKSDMKGNDLTLIQYFLEQSPLFVALLLPIMNPWVNKEIMIHISNKMCNLYFD